MNNLANLSGEEKEKIIPYTFIVGLFILLAVFGITLFSLTFKGLYVLHYSESSNLDYKVYLKESAWDLYNGKKYLTKDKVYIASTMDYVDTNFYYTFKSDDNLDINYSYYISANIQYKNADGGDFDADYNEILLEGNSYSKVNDNTFKINENIKIDYNKYNSIASNFISSTGITATANLVVRLYADVVGNHAEFQQKISDKAAITLTIPLVTSTPKFEMDYKLSNNYDATLQYRSTIINNPVLFYACITLGSLDLIAMAVIIAYIILTRDDATLYKKRLNKILKDYDKYISETFVTENIEELMKTKSLRIEVVKTFEGLVDIRDNLNVPILFHEEKPGKEAVFYILTDRIGYIYIMKKEDIKKKTSTLDYEVKGKKKSLKKAETLQNDYVIDQPIEEEPDLEELNNENPDIEDNDRNNIDQILSQTNVELFSPEAIINIGDENIDVNLFSRAELEILDEIKNDTKNEVNEDINTIIDTISGEDIEEVNDIDVAELDHLTEETEIIEEDNYDSYFENEKEDSEENTEEDLAEKERAAKKAEKRKKNRRYYK